MKVTPNLKPPEFSDIDGILFDVVADTHQYSEPNCSDEACFQSLQVVVAAECALKHLEQNFSEIERIFSDFQISKSDYHLLAGFDEDLLQNRLGYLDQIHVLIHSEPLNMTFLLSQLEKTFMPFSAIVFTEKSNSPSFIMPCQICYHWS